MTAIAEQRWLQLPLVLLAALVVGVGSFVEPLVLAGAIGAAAVGVLAWHRPVGNLVWVVLLTAVVPYGLQKRVGISRPGLLLSDYLLLVGLAWAFTMWASRRFDRRLVAYGAVLATFIGFSALQMVHGLFAGGALNDAGAEFRTLLALGAYFLAVPILVDEAARGRLLRGLLVVAIVLGVWGIAQYVVNLPTSVFGDAGVRQGVALTSGGRGQVQGGLFGFGVAIIVCFAVMLSEEVGPRARRWLLGAIFVNVLGLLFTFERTFWVATAMGCLLVVARATHGPRMRAVLLTPVAIVGAFAALAVLAPQQLVTARERLLSIGQYSNDDSVRYRLAESRHVLERISAHPVDGSGLGATIHWGRPWEQVRPMTTTFSHDGYLWLAWKVGLPLAVVLYGLWVSALLWRAPLGGAGSVTHALRNGAQAALLSLLVVSVTFSPINAQSITATMGVLFALAVLPGARRRSRVAGPR